MKKTILLAVVFLTLIVLSQKNDIIGEWRSGADTLVIGEGYLLKNSEKIPYRLTDNELLLISNAGELIRHPYMLSFDKKMLYFDRVRYIRQNQSGIERSIIGFFLKNSPLCLS